MNLAVVGAQWGDEGKGKIVDLLAPRYNAVARYQGGNNAGHTVYFKGKRYVLKLLPSGVFDPRVTLVMGNGEIINLEKLQTDELEPLDSAGIEYRDRLFISDRMHVITPYHIAADTGSVTSKRIGTTGRGIGTCYQDKSARKGVRMGELVLAMDVDDVRKELVSRIEEHGFSHDDAIRYIDDQIKLAEPLAGNVTDTSLFLNNEMDAGNSVLFEGAQGTMLDIDHGTYPDVTSSSSAVGGISSGLGISPSRIDEILGITKAYTTRVGEGPFPTENYGPEGEALRQRGQEFGAVTGRPRRCGWFDAQVARYAARINGLTGFAVTKLDVLDSLEEIPVCVGYDGLGDWEMPSTVYELSHVNPVFEKKRGWKTPTAGARRFRDLPREAQYYLDFLEDLTGVPISIVSTGPEKSETIERKKRYVGRLFERL